MAAISGSITVFYLFDVAQAIDLSAVPALVGAAPVAARLAPKPATPPYVQYAKPPLLLEGSAIQSGTISGLTPRFKLFDYGVVSLALSRPFTGGWPELIAAGQPLIDGDPLAHEAEVCCRRLLARLGPALIHANDRFLAEDYVVFVATRLEPPATTEAFLRAHGGDIAQLLRGERQALSPEERDRVLRHRISYLADDLVVPTWNAALVRDTEAGAQAAMEILEFANSQLLEFRHYDSLLDGEAINLVHRLQLLPDAGLPPIQTEARGGQAEEPCGVHVADELDRVLGVIGQLVHVDEQGMHVVRCARVAARPEQPDRARLLQLGVQARQLGVEEAVIVPELEELRVRELQDLHSGLGSGLGVPHEGGVPRGDDQIVGEV